MTEVNQVATNANHGTTITKQVAINAEVDAVIQHFVKFAKTTKDLVKQGINFQTLPAELNAIIADLVPGIAGLPTITAAASLDPVFRKTVELGADDIVSALLS